MTRLPAGRRAVREDVGCVLEVQLSESREALVPLHANRIRCAQLRLNNVMGRNAGWPLAVVDMEVRPPLRGGAGRLLEQAAADRPEVGLPGRRGSPRGAARSPGPSSYRISCVASWDSRGAERGSGWQEGRASMWRPHSMRAAARASCSRPRRMSRQRSRTRRPSSTHRLQVNLATRHGRRQRTHRSVASRRRPGEENLRLFGCATERQCHPTDIVDSEAGPHAVAAALLLGHVYLPGSPGSPGLRGGPAAGWRVAAAEMRRGESRHDRRVSSPLVPAPTRNEFDGALRSVVTIRRGRASARAWSSSSCRDRGPGVITSYPIATRLHQRRVLQAYVIQVPPGRRPGGGAPRQGKPDREEGKVLFEIDRTVQYR